MNGSWNLIELFLCLDELSLGKTDRLARVVLSLNRQHADKWCPSSRTPHR